MKRSSLIQGFILILAAILVLAWFLHRSAGSPTVAASKPPQTPPDARSAGPESTGRRSFPEAPAAPPRPVPATPQAVRSRVLRGVVADAAGRPVPLVPVEGFALDVAGGLTRLRTESDPAGAWRLECPDRTRVTLTAHAAGHGRIFAGIDFLDPKNDGIAEHALILTMRAPLTVEGVLREADGRPLAGARLRFHPVSTTTLGDGGTSRPVNLLNAGFSDAWDERCRRELFLTDGEATTDATGAFRSESLVGSTTYRIDVLREGQPPVVLETTLRAQKDPLLLKLP